MIRLRGNIRAAGTVDGAGNSRLPTARNGFDTESISLKTHDVVANRLQRRRRGSPHPIRLRAPLSRSLPLHFRNPPENITPDVAVHLDAARIEGGVVGGNPERVEEIKGRFTHRMHDLGEFMKGLLQRFTERSNGRHKRTGTLWEQRFKSVIEGYI